MSSAKGRKAPAKGKKAQKPTEEEEDMRIREEHRAAREWLSTLSPSDVLSSDLFDEARIEQLRTEFRSKTPFPHLSIEKFVDDQFLTAMLEELKTLDYSEKNNDLYAFSQSTEDLKCVTSPLISRFRELLYSPAICKALSTISGIELFGLDNTASQPDFFAAVYSDRSRLLCHDDELEGRRIAFIVYLVPEDWCDADGGHLDLFNTDAATGAPSDIAVSHVPKRASFLCFEVSPQSYHQVREVLSANKLRVSMGGWFHGPPITRKAPMVEPAAPAEALEPAAGTETGAEAQAQQQVGAWVNKQYLTPKVAAQIRSAFEDDSSVELHNFLDAKAFKEILAEVAELEAKAFPAAPPAATTAAAAAAELVAAAESDDDNDDDEDESGGDDDAATAAGPAAMGDTDDGAAAGAGASAKVKKGKAKGKGKKALGSKKAGAKKGAGKKAKAATGVVLPALAITPVAGLGVVRAGPANFRCFYEHAGAGETLQFGASGERAPVAPVTPRLDALVRFMRTERFSEFVESLTGMKMRARTAPSRRLFRRGCYTLAHDHDMEQAEEGLDVVLTFMDPRAALRWTDADGGSLHYLKAGADEELLTVMPVPNSITLVYREGASSSSSGVMQFTRYLSHSAPCSLYQVRLTYRLEEMSDDDEGDEDEEDDGEEGDEGAIDEDDE